MPPPQDEVESSTDQEILIGVVGVTGSGKSDFIKCLTQCEDIIVGDDSESQTKEVKQYPLQHNGLRYVLVDTPGFDDSRKEFDDEAIFKLLAKWLVETYRSNQLLNGLIYLLPINNTRQRGSESRNQRMIKKVCGAENFKNIMLGLTFCDKEAEADVQARKKELMENERWWAGMVKRGAVVEEIPFLDRNSCLTILERFAPKKKMTLQLQSEVVDQGKAIDDTAAFHTVHEGLAKIRAEIEEKIAETKRTFELSRAKAVAVKRERMRQLGHDFEQGRRSHQEQEAALLLHRQKREEDTRQERARLEETRKKDEEKRLRKERDLEDAVRQVQLEDERFQKRQKDLKQQALKIRAFHSDLISNANALNRWGANGGVTHDNIKGHGMLGNFCDHCLIPSFPKQGHVFTCEKCYSDSNNPLRDLQDGDKTLMLCASCKAEGHSCLDSTHKMTAEPIPVLTGLSRCKRTGYEKDISCNKCRKRVKESLYLHCCGCEADDFDLCMSCWGKGKGCKSLSHTLHVLSWCPPRIRVVGEGVR